MSKELSALLDGELETHETAAVWAALKADPGLRRTWGEYRLVGEALRGEDRLDADLTTAVMDRLADEPVVFLPRKAERPRWTAGVLALAASLAGVAVVGWLALSSPPPGGGTLHLAGPAGPAGPAPGGAPVAGFQSYILAHQANAPGLHLSGGTQHIRTISATGSGR